MSIRCSSAIGHGIKLIVIAGSWFVMVAANANAVSSITFNDISWTIRTPNAPSCSIVDAGQPGNGYVQKSGTNATAIRSYDIPSCAYNSASHTLNVNFDDANVFTDTGAFLFPQGSPFANATIVNQVYFVDGMAFDAPGTLTLGLSGSYSALASTDVVVPDPSQGLFGGSETSFLEYALLIAAYSFNSGQWSYYQPLLNSGVSVSNGETFSASAVLPSSYSIPVSAGQYEFQFSTFLVASSQANYRVDEPHALVLLVVGLLALGLVGRRKTPLRAQVVR